MKKTLLVFLAVLAIGSQASAQFKKGSTEISLLGGGGSLSESGSSSGITYVTLAVAPAYFIADGLSIEPEIGFTLLSGESDFTTTGFSLIGNLSYTFASDKSSTAPYLRAGAGISNGIQFPVFSGLVLEVNSGTVTIFNAAAGVKFVVGSHAAIRTEVIYKEQSYSFSGSSSSHSISNIGVQFGLSLLP